MPNEICQKEEPAKTSVRFEFHGVSYEPRHAKTKAQISCAVIAQLISAFVFVTWMVQFLFFLNLKFQDSSHLL